jgi:hypothetical protein
MEIRMKLKCSVEDFIQVFETEMPKYSTYKGAYEAAEKQHEQLTGSRRYSDYESFRKVKSRRRKK